MRLGWGTVVAHLGAGAGQDLLANIARTATRHPQWRQVVPYWRSAHEAQMDNRWLQVASPTRSEG